MCHSFVLHWSKLERKRKKQISVYFMKKLEFVFALTINRPCHSGGSTGDTSVCKSEYHTYYLTLYSSVGNLIIRLVL